MTPIGEDKKDKAHVTLFPDTPGVRLDVYIAGAGLNLSRSQAQRLIDDGLALVGGKVKKPNYRIRPGDSVSLFIPPPEPVSVLPEDIPLKVIYEDDDIIVIDKPPGMVVHPSPGHYSGTLVNALLHHCRDLSGIGGELRPGIVHRLDKDTSGVMVAAKNDGAHKALSAGFKAHAHKREYVAIVRGGVRDAEGSVVLAIGRHVTDRKRMSPTSFRARDAVTHFRVIERFGVATLVSLRLATGRTHQIRVHMSHIGHPVAGDRVYGGKGAGRLSGMKVPRQMLHAKMLGFVHPTTGSYVEFYSEAPEDFMRVLEFLRAGRATGAG